ncbi:probable palmitoyltransferase ZDHHC24 [Drosophila subpulchrella]|uniref:probable palmitoyltransferase ZDHHC24 n=1 Tax=Drosophila subpulchrella TaxID=1486046 RepID=UPI0018A156C9|nr:probable palmitoyltransferase ZDHHC24 [Drosophila subpulchrella]
MCILIELFRESAKSDPKNFVRIAHPLSVILVLAGSAFFVSLQMFHVVPNIFGVDTFMHRFGWVTAIFITYNILGNMLACYFTSSSVESLPKDCQVPVPEEEHLWRYCETCEKLMPPRSWHCILCKCCILKRDHHCSFTANCIGHNNHRYFFWFTFYLTLGTSLSLAALFIDAVMEFWSFVTWRRLLLLETSSLKSAMRFVYCRYIIILLNVFAGLFPAHMLYFQIESLKSNSTYYKIYSRHYNLGFRKNCQDIMGQRGLWTFLSPMLKSPLPRDGTRWPMKQAV